MVPGPAYADEGQKSLFAMTHPGPSPLFRRSSSMNTGAVDPQRIVLPVNTADHRADRAVPTAIAAARLFNCSLELLQFVEDPHEVRRADQALAAVAASIRRSAPDVTLRSSTIVEPHAPRGLVAAVQPAHLMVMATRASHFGLVHYVGSAADCVIADSGRPVLLVGPACDFETGLKVTHVVVPVDPDDPSFGTLPLAQHWADRMEVPLTMVAVVTNDSSGHETKRQLQELIHALVPEIMTTPLHVIRAPDPASAIVSLGNDALIVMDSHSCTGLQRLAIGSTTTEVVRRATEPVLVVGKTPSPPRGSVSESRVAC